MRHILLPIVFSLGCQFGTSLVFAEPPQCNALFSSEFALNGRIEVEALGLKGGLKASDYARRIQEIDSLLGPLVTPVQTRILVGDQFAKSSFNARSKNVYVGIRPEKMGSKNPRVNLATLSHEYGHAIFEANLYKDLASYKLQFDTFIRVGLRGAELTEQTKALRYRADVTFDKKLKTELSNQLRTALAELQIVTEQKETIDSYWAVRRALHEVFADATALVATKDPKSIFEILVNSENKFKEHSSDDIALRDFTDGRHHLNSSTWNRLSMIRTQIFGDVYYAFLPVRWALWKTVKSRIDSDTYRKKLLPKLFTILERNLSETLALKPEALGPKGFNDLERMNKQLIEDIQRELGST